VLTRYSVSCADHFTETSADGREHEQGVFGRGFDNGLVAIARRLMATGLLSVKDLETEEV